ncbi:MAG: hypothetical protein ACR2JY_14935 [Chloroflexota bacterium]
MALLIASRSSAMASADGCQFVLGFQTLHEIIPATVGSCLEDEQHNPANGDALQHTTGGLLVWRKADNWTAFTDGYHTWVNGPHGLEERLNTRRFAWEANVDGLPIVPDASVNLGRVVVDTALGIALALPSGWQQSAPGKSPPHELGLIIPPANSAVTDSIIRLVIGSWGTTTDPDETRAAAAGMDRLLAGLGALPRPITRLAVSYAGAPGVLVHGLPGGLSGATTAIILAHDGAAYKILAPGNALAPDQQQALDSLRFIPRVGHFPPAR